MKLARNKVSAYFAALVFGFFIVVVAIFQLALAAGVPWGSVAMAGKFPGRLPPRMRVAAFLQVFVLTVLGVVVWTRAGIIFAHWYTASEKFIWAVVAFAMLGFMMNLITPVKWERLIWAPVAAILLASGLIVALS
jgi:hypothetical protein